MEYRIKEMKQNTETMERKGYRHHAAAVLSVIAGMLVAVSLTAHGKDINPQKADTLRCLTTTAQKHRREVSEVSIEQQKLPIIYSTTHGGAALLSSLATTKWVKCWPIAPREHSIR